MALTLAQAEAKCNARVTKVEGQVVPLRSNPTKYANCVRRFAPAPTFLKGGPGIAGEFILAPGSAAIIPVPTAPSPKAEQVARRTLALEVGATPGAAPVQRRVAAVQTAQQPAGTMGIGQGLPVPAASARPAPAGVEATLGTAQVIGVPNLGAPIVLAVDV